MSNDTVFEVLEIHIEYDGPTARHNFPCPICQTQKAVYVLNDGIFTPCWKCRETWTTRRRTFIDDIVDWLKGRAT